MKKTYKYLSLTSGIIIVLLVFFLSNSKNIPNKAPVVINGNNQSVVTKNWLYHKFDEVGLSFSSPSDLSASGEQIDKNTFTLYVQRGKYPEKNYYQLYGLYNLAAGNIDSNDLKKDLEENSIKETTVAGYKAVSGQNKGQRNRFVTYIITNRGLFTLATSQPTEKNKELTDSILKTFELK